MSEKTIGIFQKPSNQKLIGELKAKQIDVFLLPQIETSSVNNLSGLKLDQFDWLIFTDCHAVEHFLQLLEENKADKFELDNLRICASGEAVSDKLRMFQIHADVIPSKLTDDNIFQAICDYQIPSGLRFLLTEKNTNLANLLRNANAGVIEITVYQTKIVGESSKLKVLIENGAIDEVIFTSPNEVNDWKLLISPNNFVSSFNEIIPLAIDARTFQYLYEHGLNPRNYQK
jgi:uroporphyrinogen-III synthase